MREYKVYEKRKRNSTEVVIASERKMDAIAQFAFRRGLKTFNCDAVLVRKKKDS